MHIEMTNFRIAIFVLLHTNRRFYHKMRDYFYLISDVKIVFYLKYLNTTAIILQTIEVRAFNTNCSSDGNY